MADNQKTDATAAGEQPSAPQTTEPPKAPEAATAPAAQPQLSSEQRTIAELKAQVDHLTEKLAKLASPKPRTVDEYLAEAPEEIRHSLMEVHRAQTKRRLEMVDDLIAAPGCLFSKDELDKMPIDQLEKLVGLAARTDYGVQPAPRSRVAPHTEAADYAPVPEMPWDKPKAAASH